MPRGGALMLLCPTTHSTSSSAATTGGSSAGALSTADRGGRGEEVSVNKSVPFIGLGSEPRRRPPSVD
jgi:hypothetical protein